MADAPTPGGYDLNTAAQANANPNASQMGQRFKGLAGALARMVFADGGWAKQSARRPARERRTYREHLIDPESPDQ